MNQRDQEEEVREEMNEVAETSKSKTRLHAIVSGRVQGVNFRYYTVRTAKRHGLTGWVANRRDGKVEVIAEGARRALQKLEDFLHDGSPAARVRDVDVEWKSATGEFGDFRVKYL